MGNCRIIDTRTFGQQSSFDRRDFGFLQTYSRGFLSLQARLLWIKLITSVETTGPAIGGIVTGRLADPAGGDYTGAFYGVILVTGLALITVVILSVMVKPRPSFS